MKTYKIDSETLTHRIKVDLVPESWVPPKEIRELRELTKRRSFLVGMRTKVKNHVRTELAKLASYRSLIFTTDSITSS